jgi:DNA repair protein SbcD/Mre11
MQWGPGMRLLHVADVHLGAAYGGFGQLAPRRRREVLDAFRRLPDHAAEARADAVLFAGDLFDGPHPDREILSAVRDTLRRFVDLCIPVFLVPGNHDAITLKLNPYRELARGARVVVQDGQMEGGRRWPVRDEQGRQLAEKHSIYLLARSRMGEAVTVQTESGTLHVYGIAYDPAQAPDPLDGFRRQPADGVHVALLHAYVQGVGRRRRHRNALSLALDDLDRLDVDYVALGDQHRTLGPEHFDGRPACYPGSFAATDPAELGPRGFVLVDLEPGAPPRVELRDAGAPRAVAIEVDVSGCDSDARVAAVAAQRLPPGVVPVVRLVGDPAFPLDADAVAARLIGRFGHAVVTDETGFYAVARLAELARTDTVAGHVVRLGRARVAEAEGERQREVLEQALRAALRALEVS